MLASAGQCRKTLGVILWRVVILRRRAVYFWIYFFVRIGCFYVADIQLGDCFLIQYRLLNQLHVDEQGDDCEDIEEYFEDKDVPYNREEKTRED